MNNFDHAAKATATSINSAGSAMRENEAYQQSLEYQTNNLKATFQDFANNVLDKDVVSAVLKVGDAFLKLANTDIGQFVSKVTLLGGTAWGVESLIHVSKILPTIITQFANFGKVLSMIGNPAVVQAIGGIGTAISTVGGFSAIALPSLLAISAALIGIIEAVKYISTADTRKLESLSSSLQETNDKIAEMTATGSEYDTLIQNTENLTEVEKTRLGILQAQLDTLQAQSKEQENAYLTEWQRQQTEQKTETTHKLVTGSADEVPEGAQKLYGQYWDVVTTTEYTESQRAAENLRTAINNLNSEKRLGVTVGSEYISKLQGIIDEYQETYDTTIKVRDAGYELDDSQQYLVKVMEHQKEVVSSLGAEYAQNSEDIQAFSDATDESASKLDTYIAALNEYRGANEDAASSSEILVDSLFDANGQLTEAAKQALTTDGAMASMAQSFIEAQQAQTQADFSALILAIERVGSAAAVTSAQIANMMAMAGVDSAGTAMYQKEYQLAVKNKDTTLSYNEWMAKMAKTNAEANYKTKMEEYQKQLESIKPYVPSGGGGGGSSSSKSDNEEVKKQTIKTIEELREYLTDEKTRLKLIDPDISKSDLQSTLSEVATIYQSYQDYLSSLKQQGFDETSEQYQQAEAEFAQFVETLKTLFAEIVATGKYDVDELVEYITKNCGDLSSNISSLLDGLETKVTDTVSSISTSIHQAFASGDSNSAIGAIENAWSMIRSMSDGSDILDDAISSALNNASAEQEAADKLSEEYEWQNKLLEDKIKLEEKLEALEKAKQRRMLVYSEGRFQYMQDADAISSAQKEYQETYRRVEQDQMQKLISDLGDKSAEFFTDYFNWQSENGAKHDYKDYPAALRSYLEGVLKDSISGSVFEGLSDDELSNIFGGAMRPGEAYGEIVKAEMARADAIEKKNERKAELKKQIREENVRYYGVDTDFGEKIKNAQSQSEAAYWAQLRDTKLDMIKEYQEAYGTEAASKYFGVDTSKISDWKSNADLYQEAWASGNMGYSISDWERQHMYDNDEQYRYTVENPDLTAAQYNVVAGLTFDRYSKGDQSLYGKIFRGSISKDKLQELYNSDELSDVTKGYILSLASELKKSGATGYARGTRNANSGLSIVGENGPELRVLNQGDGILPSGITDNLWRWGSMTPTDMLQSLAQRAQSMLQTLNISNVTLPNVHDAQSFVSGLREYAQQYITRRN